MRDQFWISLFVISEKVIQNWRKSDRKLELYNLNLQSIVEIVESERWPTRLKLHSGDFAKVLKI
jgi:hypothetical protein